jgi:hypothetical protein
LSHCSKSPFLYLLRVKSLKTGNHQMRKVSALLLALSVAGLSACGGSEGSGANNSVEEVNVASDDLTVSDNLGAADSLGNQANALEGDAGNLANGADANLVDTGNAVGNALSNAAGNSQ